MRSAIRFFYPSLTAVLSETFVRGMSIRAHAKPGLQHEKLGLSFGCDRSHGLFRQRC
jgi:hypothetical protein